MACMVTELLWKALFIIVSFITYTTARAYYVFHATNHFLNVTGGGVCYSTKQVEIFASQQDWTFNQGH